MLPLLAARLSNSGFGRLAILQAAFQYGLTIAGFGFQLSAARQVAVARSDARRLGAVVICTLLAKASLGLIVLISAWALWAFAGTSTISVSEMVAGSSAIFATVLFPMWLLQGLEWFGLLAATMAITRACTLALIWLMVQSTKDAGMALAAQYFPLIIASIGLFVFTLKRAGFSLQRPTVDGIKLALREAGHGFSGNVAYWFYVSTNVLILGKLTSPEIVAGFSAADRVIQAIRGFVYGGVQAALPSFARSGENAYARIRRAILVVFPTFAVGCVMLALSSEFIVRILYGPTFERAAHLLRWMSPIPLLAALGQCIATLGLFGRGRADLWSFVIILSAFVDLFGLAFLHFVTDLPADECVVFAVVAADASMLTAAYLLFTRDAERTT